MTYHRIIKHVTGSIVYAITRPSINQSDNTWGAFNRQERVIILLPETLSSKTPLRVAGEVCVIHVGWPSSAQRYRSQLALHDALCSVLVAYIHDKQIFPSCEELVGETAPWPLEDKKTLQNEVSRLFPKFEAALLEIPQEMKEKFYQDWIEVHASGGHRCVLTWDPATLVNRANLYIFDVLGYHRSTYDWSMPQFPLVPQAFVSRNGLDSAVDNGVLFVVERDPGLNRPIDLPPDASPIDKPISNPVPGKSNLDEERLAEKDTVTEAPEFRKPGSEGKFDPIAPDGGQTALVLVITEPPANGPPTYPTTDPSNTHQTSSESINEPEPTPTQASNPTREYFVVLEDFDVIPAICMLAKDSSCKNIICYVQIVGVMQTLIAQINALTSKPIFVIASPNSAALPGALKAFNSNTGVIVFCNYLLPLCEALRTQTVHRIIHVGWTGKLDLYAQQINTTANAQNCIVMTQSQYSGISDPNAIFGEPHFKMTRNVLDPAAFGSMVTRWENQLNHASKKALNGCYMEWIAYHGLGQYKVAEWSAVELVSQANAFGEKVLKRRGDCGALEASAGLVRHLQLQPAVQAGVLRVTK